MTTSLKIVGPEAAIALVCDEFVFKVGAVRTSAEGRWNSTPRLASSRRGGNCDQLCRASDAIIRPMRRKGLSINLKYSMQLRCELQLATLEAQ